MLDPKTRLVLYKLVNGETLEAVNGCISTGKEACVFHAYGGRCVISLASLRFTGDQLTSKTRKCTVFSQSGQVYP